MRRMKVILVEGIPGSGKSTTAQFLARQLSDQGIPEKWWYEEERGHPLKLYDDFTAQQQITKELHSGHHRRVTAAALERWQRFATECQRGDTVTLLDSCLFGDLTWSLFFAAVEEAEIHAYQAAIARLIAPLAPCLVYLRPHDVRGALRRVLDQRGPVIEQRYIAFVTASPYGRQQGLHGFEGLVQFWTTYRAFTDRCLATTPFAKLCIAPDGSSWAACRQELCDFLELPPATVSTLPSAMLSPFVGTYWGGTVDRCEVTLEQGELYVDGVPSVWPHTRLLPLSNGVFAVESLPFVVRFAPDATGAIVTLTITGPETGFQRVDRVFRREQGVSSVADEAGRDTR